MTFDKFLKLLALIGFAIAAYSLSHLLFDISWLFIFLGIPLFASLLAFFQGTKALRRIFPNSFNKSVQHNLIRITGLSYFSLIANGLIQIILKVSADYLIFAWISMLCLVILFGFATLNMFDCGENLN